jgi:AraC-like DNA-binding protein
VISIDPLSKKGRVLINSLNGQSHVLLNSIYDSNELKYFVKSYWDNKQNNSSEFNPYKLVETLDIHPNSNLILDRRVEQALYFIDSHISESFKVEEISGYVGLSESRLRTLFNQNVGISLSSYILWHRMKLALKYLAINHKNLGESAHEAGFTDHPHFTRTFRKMFGVSPY